jgi:predicted transposase/invertase (TIGR01784 family)
MLGVWERAEKDGRALPPVIPIVLYQGRETWTVRSLSQSFPDLPERLTTFLPDFSFLLVDLAHTSSETLQATYANRSLLVAMELMKAIFSREEVSALMERLTPEDGPVDRDLAYRFLRVVLRYIFKRSGTTVREALALNLHPMTREQTMTMEEEILQRGEKRGIEQGLRQKALEDAHKMLEHGIEWTVVTDVTGIRPEDLEG